MGKFQLKAKRMLCSSATSRSCRKNMNAHFSRHFARVESLTLCQITRQLLLRWIWVGRHTNGQLWNSSSTHYEQTETWANVSLYSRMQTKRFKLTGSSEFCIFSAWTLKFKMILVNALPPVEQLSVDDAVLLLPRHIIWMKKWKNWLCSHRLLFINCVYIRPNICGTDCSHSFKMNFTLYNDERAVERDWRS